jgi:hypothetical protein
LENDPVTIKVVIGSLVFSKNKIWKDVNLEVETWINLKDDEISAFPFIEPE